MVPTKYKKKTFTIIPSLVSKISRQSDILSLAFLIELSDCHQYCARINWNHNGRLIRRNFNYRVDCGSIDRDDKSPIQKLHFIEVLMYCIVLGFHGFHASLIHSLSNHFAIIKTLDRWWCYYVPAKGSHFITKQVKIYLF